MSTIDPKRPSPAVGSRQRRARVTQRSVHVAERVARVFITFGGLGTVVAVTTIFAFLLWVIVPLFQDAQVGGPSVQTAGARGVPAVAVGCDEHGVLTWTVFADGRVEVRTPLEERPLLERTLAEGAQPTAFSISPDGLASAVGYADGSVRLVRIGFGTELLSDTSIPPALASMAAGERRVHQGRLAARLPTGEVRLQSIALTVGQPIPLGERPIVRLDRADLSGGYALLTVDAEGKATFHRIEEKQNILNRSKPPQIRRASADLPYERMPGSGLPVAVGVPGAGDNAYLLWEDGRALRFDTRDLDAVALVETVDLVPEPGARVSAVGWMLGRTTLMVGDTSGFVRGSFRTKPYEASTLDGSLFTQVHLLGGGGPAVTSISAGQRNRVVAVGYADGAVRVFQATNERTLAEVARPGEPIQAVAIAPKEDAVLARSAVEVVRWPFDARHPEAGMAAVFGKVWYEGLEKPEHVWQSVGGTDDFEPKLGLVPLIFGTLKATLYSMLFGVPIALLAAIFTSEFLSARLRTSVKSVIEIMASLPSVVLGFLAAIVVAPFVQDVIPTVLTCFLMLPTLLLLGAHLWQLLPQHLALRMAGLPRLACLVAVFPLAILLSSALAPGLERALFRGDLLAWLNHDVSSADLVTAGVADVPAGATVSEERRELALALGGGTLAPTPARARELIVEAGAQVAGKKPAPGKAPLLQAEEIARVREEHGQGAWGGWAYITFPIAVILVLFVMARVVNPWVRQASKAWSRGRCALVALGKLGGGMLAAVLVAWLLGHGMASLGFDPRGSFEYATRGEGALMGSPVQRNALVVGFLMGFAIIPIIYTLAEDALSSVPSQLRLGSLGAGATPWQTATRIIIPTAMSGLFSAVMIGLGRAVGETMIVLMAAGNTSVMDLNVFNGFRTLSANIATEMPEAVAGSTHYRVLFLAAFTLFAITFVLNTLAESVRQRFRKRAFQL